MSKKIGLVELEMMEVIRGPVENLDHAEEFR